MADQNAWVKIMEFEIHEIFYDKYEIFCSLWIYGRLLEQFYTYLNQFFRTKLSRTI